MNLTHTLITAFWFRRSFFLGTEKTLIQLVYPTIFYHDGEYYLCGTSGNDKNLGFEVYVSKNLKSWKRSDKNNGEALKKGASYGDIGFWAPQVFEFEGMFYMASTANEHIAKANSESPLGPFTQTEKKAVQAPLKQIDPYVFIDDDGKKYLYHVRSTEGNRLFVAEQKYDFSGIKEETLTYCFYADQLWENTQNVDWKVSEGPSIIKHEGFYYFIYSAIDLRNLNYAVGYEKSESPMGPWTKSTSNPISDKADDGINASGCGDFFVESEGKLRYVLHTHNSDEKVSLRKTALSNWNLKKMETNRIFWKSRKRALNFLN